MFSFSKLILPIALFAPCINATVYLPKGITMQSVQTANIIIAWDIHNVPAIEDGSAKAGAIAGDIFPIIWTKLFDTSAWDEIKRIKKTNKDISGEAYMQVFLKHGQKKMARMAENAANAYKPRPGMLQLVRDIDSAGVVQRLASNIGPQCLVNLDNKFKSKKYNCNIFDYIKPGKIVDYSMYGPTHLRKASLAPELSAIGKPDMGFFIGFNNTYNPNNEYLIIFIDDKMENIQTAVAAGWIGIHLNVNDKDPVTTLRSDLTSLGVFAKKQIAKPLIKLA